MKSIEELINEIKLINKKIEIIFFLNKKNKNKEEKLKKIKVNKIYYIKKINNKYKNNKKNIKNKIIAIYGEPQSGKTTIKNLLLIYLIKNDKKILLLNLNKNNNYIDGNHAIYSYLSSPNEFNDFLKGYYLEDKRTEVENLVTKAINVIHNSPTNYMQIAYQGEMPMNKFNCVIITSDDLNKIKVKKRLHELYK